MQRKKPSIDRLAMNAIARSASIDFRDALSWAQWCRDLAWAANDGDRDAVEALSKRANPKATEAR